MARPNPYTRQRNFTNWQSNNPGVIYNGTDFDTEFNAIASVLNQTVANLALIQRGDGAIANQSVGRDQLAASVVQGINAPAGWVTGHAYSQRDSVIINNIWYWCNIAHTSGVFATDLAAGDWILINDFSLALSNPFSATSTTNNVAIGTGAKTLTIQSGKSFVAGQFVAAIDSGNSANSMTGTITSYSGTTLVLNIPTGSTTGSGTPTGWNVVISGPQGAQGASGSGSGNMLNTGASVSGQVPKYTDATGTNLAPGYTIGTAANNLVALDGSAKLPAVDGSQLTNIFQWNTGNVRITIDTTPAATWIMLDDGTIGDASSGASNRANADTSALFTKLWTNFSNTNCPVSGGRGASAAADFAAHKTIQLPQMLGRVLGVAGSGSGLTARNLGDSTGAETVTLTAAQQASMPVTGSVTITGGTTPRLIDSSNNGAATLSGALACSVAGNLVAPSGSISGGVATGGGGSHPNMQPTGFLKLEMKL